MNNNKISVFKAMLLGVNIMVGGGILTGTSKMVAIGGSLSFMAWIFGAVLNLPIVWSVAKLAEFSGEQSGISNYCQMGLGRFWGFVGGVIYTCGYSMSIMAILGAFGEFLSIKFPSIFIFSNPLIFFALALLVLAYINCMDIATLASIQGALTVVKLTPVVTAVALLPFFFSIDPFVFNVANLGQSTNAITTAFFGFLGFEFAANLTNHIKGGASQAKKAIFGGFFLVAFLYVAFHISVTCIMGAENVVTKLVPNFPLFVVDRFPMLGKALLILIPFTAMVTYFNSSNGMYLLLVTSIGDLVDRNIVCLPEALKVKNQVGRPVNVVIMLYLLLYTVGVALSYLSGSYSNFVMLSMFLSVFGIFAALGLSLLSLICLKENRNKIVPFLGLLVIIFVMGYSFVNCGSNMIERFSKISVLLALLTIALFSYKSEAK